MPKKEGMIDMISRNSIVLFIVILLFAPLCFAQNLYDGPEGIVFDSVDNRYLVANATSGEIIEVDMNGIQSVFATGLGVPLGLHIYNDILFAANNDPNQLLGFDLQTAEIVKSINFNNAVGLSGIEIDNSGYLYLVDQIGKIYKVNIQTESYTTFVNSSQLNGLQGILLDEDDNRLIAVGFPFNSPVYGIDMADSSISVITMTTIGRFTGIAGDALGNVYATSWRTNCVYKWDSEFANPVEIFSTGHDQPTGIYCNDRDDILAVSNYGSSTVDFIPMGTSDIDDEIVPAEFISSKCYPNPFNNSTQIEYSLMTDAHVEINIYDLLGRKLETPINEFQSAGNHSLNWNANYLSSGIYFYTIQVNDVIETKSMTLLK
jgi:DNA-binding beta-propeller fold protein YncE